MLLDSKLKMAAFDTAIKGILINKKKYPDRTARNILDLGATIFRRPMDDEEKKKALLQLREKLPACDDDVLAYIKDLFL